MSEKSSFKDGYEYFQENVSTFTGSLVNEKTNIEYLNDIENEIRTLKDEINNRLGNMNPQLKGYVAEDWARGTFNIDAASKRTGERVWTPPANDFASADLESSWGDSFQAKFYKNGQNSAFAQSATYKQEYFNYLAHCRKDGLPEVSLEEFLEQRNIDPNIDINLPIYEAQARLIPSDQLEDAIKALKDRINTEAARRPEEVARYQDTLNKLVDRVKSPKGAESLPLSENESKTLASLGREGKFDPARYDITLARKADYLYLCQNTIYSGLTAALISSVLKAAPDIAKAIIKLVKDGKIDENDLEKIGTDAFSGAKRGFVNGFVVAAIRNSCSLGYFGEKLQQAAQCAVNPAFNNIVVILSTILIETMSDTIVLTKKKITKEEYSYRLEKRVFISGCTLAGGAIVQGLLTAAPAVGYVIGSFVGSVIGGALFEIKEQFFISLCIKRGYTFFGLVKQDYALPEEVVKRLGLETFEFESFDYEEFEPVSFDLETFHYETFDFETTSFVMLKRGVIGVRKIGYL